MSLRDSIIELLPGCRFTWANLGVLVTQRNVRTGPLVELCLASWCSKSEVRTGLFEGWCVSNWYRRSVNRISREETLLKGSFSPDRVWLWDLKVTVVSWFWCELLASAGSWPEARYGRCVRKGVHSVATRTAQSCGSFQLRLCSCPLADGRRRITVQVTGGQRSLPFAKRRGSVQATRPEKPRSPDSAQVRSVEKEGFETRDLCTTTV